MSAPIDDHLVFDTHLGEYVPFANPSDAMIARLALTLDIPLHSVDLFLDILHNNSFKPGEVTIRRAGDIYLHVCEFRAERALVCAIRPPIGPVQIPGSSEHKEDVSPVPSYAFPSFILEVVLGEILRQYDAIPRSCRIEGLIFMDVFLHMTLVHRSWTIPSQRALAFSVDINIAKDMRNVACSPIFGAWTRRLSIDFSCYNLKDDYFPVYESPKRLEGCRLSSLALRHFTNTRHLDIKFHGLRDDDLAFGQEILRCVSKMPLLEELSADIKSCALVSMICSMLPCLQLLRSLRVTVCSQPPGFGSDSVYQPRQELFVDLAPGRNLEHVFVAILCHTVEPIFPIVEWILRPRDDWSIKSLRIDNEVWEVAQTMRIFDVIQPALPHLLSLELHAAIRHNAEQESELLGMILRRCTLLRRLALCIRQDPDVLPYRLDDLLKLSPSTLQELWCRSAHGSPYCLFTKQEREHIRTQGDVQRVQAPAPYAYRRGRSFG